MSSILPSPRPSCRYFAQRPLVIADDQGKIIKSEDAQQLIAGKSITLDLNADTDLPSGTNRVQIHALTLTPNPGCALIPTLEIIDNFTGKTVVILGSKVTFPRPQPAQPGGAAEPSSRQ